MIDGKRIAQVGGPKISMVELRRAIDTWDPRWWDDHWPASACLGAIALCHTDFDLSYRKDNARGLFAIDFKAFGGSDTVATDPGSVWIDPEVLAIVSSRSGIPTADPVTGNPTTREDWIGCLLNQLWFSEGAIRMQWRHPAPLSTVWEENIQKGAGALSIETVQFEAIPVDEQQGIRFANPADGRDLDDVIQYILWVLASRATIMAHGWWHPTDCRRLLTKALADFSMDHKTVSIRQAMEAAGALGWSRTVTLLNQWHTAIVYDMTINPMPWLTRKALEANGYAENLVGQWIRGEKAIDDLSSTINDIIAKPASNLFWLLAGGAALGLALYGYGKGRGGAK